MDGFTGSTFGVLTYLTRRVLPVNPLVVFDRPTSAQALKEVGKAYFNLLFPIAAASTTGAAMREQLGANYERLPQAPQFHVLDIGLAASTGLSLLGLEIAHDLGTSLALRIVPRFLGIPTAIGIVNIALGGIFRQVGLLGIDLYYSHREQATATVNQSPNIITFPSKHI